MGRPAEIERHDRRLAIDLCISNRVPWLVIADAFGIHEQTARRYKARMLGQDSGYFDKYRIARFPRGSRDICKVADGYVAEFQARLIAHAESAFKTLS